MIDQLNTIGSLKDYIEVLTLVAFAEDDLVLLVVLQL